MSDPRHSPALLNAIAQSLFELAGSAEELGTALSSDTAVVERHQTRLQEIDLLGQTLCQLADLLVSDEPSIALEAVRLERLRDELTLRSSVCSTQQAG